MLSAKQLSQAIRLKRKKMKAEGTENAVDTAPHPQMDANDVMLTKQTAQWQETMDTPEKSSAPSDPADEELDGTQKTAELSRRMSRVERAFKKLKVSGE